MFSFKKKSVNDLNKEYFDSQYKNLIENYINCEAKWYKLDQKDAVSEVINNFNNCVDQIVDYIRDFYPSVNIECEVRDFDVNNCDMLDFKDLEKHVCQESMFMLVKPIAMPDMLYLGDRNKVYTCPCIYFNKGIVYSAENMFRLDNLHTDLKKEKFNNIFIGLDVFEVKALLDQMNLLTPHNELDEYLDIHNNLTAKYEIFVKAIINRLIVNGGLNFGLKRALIFANVLGFDFDFSYFLSHEDVMYKKLINKDVNNN